jgi:hypothetical protein
MGSRSPAAVLISYGLGGARNNEECVGDASGDPDRAAELSCQGEVTRWR